MTNQNKKSKWHLKPRIFTMLLLLLSVVFLAVFLAFNVFVGGYIRASVSTQLTELTGDFARRDEAGKAEHGNLDISSQPKSKIGARVEIFALNTDYEILKYGDKIDKNEIAYITAYLKDRKISIIGLNNLRINIDRENYYISSVQDEKDNSVFVFFVNATSLYQLVNTINVALVAIMAIALLLSFVIANAIANSITSPTQKLSDFATQIGKGNFKSNDFQFIDVEFNELSGAMNMAAEKLQSYDNEQRAFFQNVSHDLRTPLMSIKCYAEGIEQGLMDVKKSSKIITQETDRLSEMVEDLLYISRIDSVGVTLDMRENDLRETASLCGERMKSLAEEKGISFKFDFDDNPVMWSYNEKYMLRACGNLVSNAIRYAKSMITLTCKTCGDKIILSVKDDGDGVPCSELPHIFERFYKGKGGNHGIGLSIAKSVVELHGGTISAISSNGMAFIIEFEKK